MTIIITIIIININIIINVTIITIIIITIITLIIKLNPWRYSPEEPRPTEAVSARRQYRGPCG